MARQQKSMQQVGQELWSLIRDYGYQETVGPLKNLGHQLKFGVPGGLLVALGSILLAIGIVRMFDRFGASLVAEHVWGYLVAMLFLLVVIGLLARKMLAGAKAGPDSGGKGTST